MVSMKWTWGFKIQEVGPQVGSSIKPTLTVVGLAAESSLGGPP
jgi:hypothetical protein